MHNHIIVNSTTLDCKRKFVNFWGSSFAVRRLSDLICAEHGLSVIKEPKPSKGKTYGDWLGADKEPSWSDKIKAMIDEVLPSCSTFEDFIAALKSVGWEVNDKKKYISVTMPGQGRPIRLKSLGEDYTEAAIRERLGMVRVISAGGDGGARVHQSGDGGVRGYQPGTTRVGLLIDIQAKIREGKGAGYENWAKIFNLKQAAKTLIYLQEQGIDSYDDLKMKASSASGGFAAQKIRETETRMAEITELQKFIGQYGKTRAVYEDYKKSGWSSKFYEEHAADIILHRAAKEHFDKLGLKKLPAITALKQEWAKLNAEKKTLYAGYREAKENSRTLAVALGNANHILGIAPEPRTHIEPQKPKRDTSDKSKRPATEI